MGEETIEAIADGALAFMAAWISIYFWQAYYRLKQKQNFYLGTVFAAVAIIKATEFIFSIFSFETFEWLETNLATEIQIALLAGVILWALTSAKSPSARASRTHKDWKKAA